MGERILVFANYDTGTKAILTLSSLQQPTAHSLKPAQLVWGLAILTLQLVIKTGKGQFNVVTPQV